jgi:Flp pilus assembly protein TadD
MKTFHFAILACVVVLTLALLWISGHRAPRERELDAKGSVIVTGDGTSRFVSQYSEAADLIGRGRVSEAEGIYMNLTKKEPSSPNGYVGLGSCCLQRNDVTGARTHYETALRLAPRSVNALVGLGTSYSLESDYANATKNYELALAVDEGSPEAHWGLAITYAKTGRRTDALNHLKRYKEFAPDSRHIAALEEIVESARGQQGVSGQPATPPRVGD